MGDFELYGKPTVSFSPSLSGSTPVFLPYTQLFFFFLVWAPWPPVAKMPWGYLSRKKSKVFF